MWGAGCAGFGLIRQLSVSLSLVSYLVSFPFLSFPICSRRDGNIMVPGHVDDDDLGGRSVWPQEYRVRHDMMCKPQIYLEGFIELV